MSENQLEKLFRQLSEELKKEEKSVAKKQPLIEEVIPVEEETEVEKIARYLSKSQKINKNVKAEHETLLSNSRKNDNVPALPSNIEANRWQDPLRENFVTHEEMRKHYTEFLQRIQTKLSTIGGSGEVRFRRLDDVKSETMNDNWLLEYDAATGKVQFTEDIGPIQTIRFDTERTQQNYIPGKIYWNEEDATLDISHLGGVVQQVGQETYALVRNRTGSTISSGTVVRFDGAENNGSARLLVAPFLGNGTFTNLYILGVATQDIEDGKDGFVTNWGKVRGLDTSTFEVGDLLYVNPSNAGKFTNIKPTAPNNVVAIAAVLKKDSTDGEIFVRPTVEQDKSYGRFSASNDITIASANTAYVISFTTTEISNGVSLGTPTSRVVAENSGYYQLDISAQVNATGQAFSAGTMYIWVKKNGNDISGSTRRQGVLASAPSATFGYGFTLSLDANDYIEIGYAADTTDIFFDGEAATAFAPSTTSVALKVTQLQQ